MVKPYGISFFEEPLTQNDVPGMAQLRRSTGMALACGQNEGLAFRFRDLLVNEAIDYAQPNVAITGGFSQCVKIAGMAASFNVSIANGGAWGFHNMHLQAGVSNGTLVEHHYLAVELYKQIYRGLPQPADGYFTMPGNARARLRARPRRHPRDCQAAAVAGQGQRVGKVSTRLKCRLGTFRGRGTVIGHNLACNELGKPGAGFASQAMKCPLNTTAHSGDHCGCNDERLRQRMFGGFPGGWPGTNVMLPRGRALGMSHR
jgi:hypothetical protein